MGLHTQEFVRCVFEKMGRRGSMIYVPPVIIEELENIMKEDGLTIKTEGFRKMVKYAKLGRRIKTQANLSLSDVKVSFPIGEKVKGRRKVKSVQDILGI